MIATLRIHRRTFVAGAAASMLWRPSLAGASVGARASTFRLRAVAGTRWRGTFDLSTHLGKRPVLLSFFATWCRPCATELPFLQKQHEKYEKRGLVVVAVSMDGPETASGISGMARRLGVSFPVLHDDDSRITARYNPRNAAPFLVVIDRSGRIVREREGWNASHQASLPGEIEKLLGD